MSFTWPLRLDNAMMHYMGFLTVEKGLTPYLHFFEPNMPFGFLLHGVLGSITGYRAFALQAVNAAVLLAMLYAMARLMAPFGKRAGYTAALLFGNILLAVGPMYAFERDYLAILPVLTALCLTLEQKRAAPVTAAAAGALLALSASFKPHMAVGLPLLLAYQHTAWGLKPAGALKLVYLPAAVSFMLVFSLPFLWLYAIGGLTAYGEIISRYLPLYSGGGGLEGIAEGIKKLGGKPLLVAPAAAGMYFALTELSGGTRRKAVLLVFVAAVYAMYPGFAGRFFPYHWFPWYCFGSIAAALLMLDRPGNAPPQRSWFPAVVLIMALFFLISPKLWLNPSAAESRSAELAEVLKRVCRPGDTVQVLDDVTAEPFAALLEARVLPGTRFLEDSQFYHDVSNPYIIGLRKEFFNAVTAAPPQYMLATATGVMSVQEQKPAVFPELYLFLHSRYSPVARGNGFILYRLNSE